MAGWILYRSIIMNNLHEDYWNDWIDNDECGVYILKDYHSYYLNIRRLDLVTDNPDDKTKFRLCITGRPHKESFETADEAKKFAKEFIDNAMAERKRLERFSNLS